MAYSYVPAVRQSTTRRELIPLRNRTTHRRLDSVYRAN